MQKLLLTTLAVLLTQSAFAKDVTCPPASMVRTMTFTQYVAYDPSIDLWEVLSRPFQHDGVTWNLVFGTEFPGVKTGEEAVKEANRVYKNHPLRNESPEALDINGYIFCDYTHEGMQYWIQALSPPGE